MGELDFLFPSTEQDPSSDDGRSLGGQTEIITTGNYRRCLTIKCNSKDETSLKVKQGGLPQSSGPREPQYKLPDHEQSNPSARGDPK